MKKLKYLLTLLLIFSLMTLNTNNSFAAKKLKLLIDISLHENLMFSTYDVDIYLNGKKLKTLKQGKTYKKTVSLKAGRKEIDFYNHNDHSVKSASSFRLKKNSAFSCKLTAKSDQIQIDDEKTQSLNSYQKKGKGTYRIGDQIRFKNMYYQVIRKSVTKKVGGKYLNNKANGRYLIIRIKIRNMDHESQTIYDNDFSIKNDSDTFNPDTSASLYLNRPIINETLNPGSTKKGDIVFDVTKKIAYAKNNKLIIDGGFSPDAEISLK